MWGFITHYGGISFVNLFPVKGGKGGWAGLFILYLIFVSAVLYFEKSVKYADVLKERMPILLLALVVFIIIIPFLYGLLKANKGFVKFLFGLIYYLTLIANYMCGYIVLLYLLVIKLNIGENVFLGIASHLENLNAPHTGEWYIDIPLVLIWFFLFILAWMVLLMVFFLTPMINFFIVFFTEKLIWNVMFSPFKSKTSAPIKPARY